MVIFTFFVLYVAFYYSAITYCFHYFCPTQSQARVEATSVNIPTNAPQTAENIQYDNAH